MNSLLLRTLRSLTTCLVIFALLMGCSKPGPDIIGTWSNAKVPETVEFRANGTGTFLYANQQNPPLSFTWSQTGDKTYLLEIPFQGSKKNLMATVKGKTLNLESDLGNELYNKQGGS